jgi:hypothetical protein
MQQFLRRTLFDQHAKSDNCLLEIVHLGIGSQFWFQPDRKKILEFKNIESICIAILVGNKKWLISGVYRPQTINDKTCNDDFIKTCDKITTK